MNKVFHKIDLSLLVLIAIPIYFIIYSEINRSKSKEPIRVVRSDAMFYHEYIAVHLFGQDPYTPREQIPVIKYTMGMAFTYMPGIAVGYLISEIQGVDHNNGKNSIYQVCLYYMGLFYAMIGLIFIRLILKKWLDGLIISVVLATIFFGTNLYYYLCSEPIMAHPASFALMTGFAYFSLKFFDKPGWKQALGMGFFLGFLTLIRPNNIIVSLFPLVLWLVQKNSWQDKVQFLKKHLWSIYIIIGMIFLFFLPQMFYWHTYTGEWLHYSYRNEKFFWTKPAILQFLFSFRKGWLIYTPVMVLTIPGAIICFKKYRELFWAILIFQVINIYIMSCWWCWWYGGSFGMRTMIDSYGIMAIWLGIFLQYVWSKTKIASVALFAVIGFLVYVNMFQTRQAMICRIHFDSMTYKAYKTVFLTHKLDLTREEWEAMLDTPDYEAAGKGKRFW